MYVMSMAQAWLGAVRFTPRSRLRLPNSKIELALPLVVTRGCRQPWPNLPGPDESVTPADERARLARVTRYRQGVWIGEMSFPANFIGTYAGQPRVKDLELVART